MTHFFLSSSSDWTINLWSKNFSGGPLLTFESNEDYIYQSKFHPQNPSLFGTVDGMGKLDLWDINISTESSIVNKDICKQALTKLDWSNDGKRLALGDSTGRIELFNVHKEIVNSSPADALKLEKILANARKNNY